MPQRVKNVSSELPKIIGRKATPIYANIYDRTIGLWLDTLIIAS